MKTLNWRVPVVMLALLPFGCSPAKTSDTMGIDGLISALRQNGATVELGEPIQQGFLTVEGRSVSINGGEVQVFEYASSDALEADASLVSADGGSVGTTMISWMDTPHFYKGGRVLVIYVGNDPAVMAALTAILDPQFAGR